MAYLGGGIPSHCYGRLSMLCEDMQSCRRFKRLRLERRGSTQDLSMKHWPACKIVWHKASLPVQQQP